VENGAGPQDRVQRNRGRDMNARLLAERHEQYVIDLRREFHRHPEPSGEERRTSSRVVAELESMGIPYEVVGECGIIAKLRGCGSTGNTVMLRADMDALPIQESVRNLAGPKTVISNVPACAHLCGHDAHTAMLLGVARGLAETQDELQGDVLLCFEQAEETTGGIAPMMLALEAQNPKAVWGIHVYSELPSGAISVEPGPRMSGMTAFSVTLRGSGGHGSRPDQTIDPLLCAAQAVTDLCSIPAREVKPTAVGVVTIGMIRAGQAGNVIPDSASFAGTARFFDSNLGERIVESVERIVTHTAAAHRCEASVTISGPHPAVINDGALSALAAGSVQTALGPERLATCEPWMASETMGCYLAKYPGVLALLGIACDSVGAGAPHHSPSFDIDESALKYGVAATLQFASDALRRLP